MAEVYRGIDERLSRPVALKVLRAHYAGDPALRTRFEDEARAIAMVSHPNVVGVYDAGEDGDTAFIVMELVPGDTLADRIARGPLDETEVRRIGGEVLDALAAAHARGVLHRDIKPANVLITEDGIAKVADFGIAKALQPSPDRNEPTALHTVLGTPSYLAPERAQGNPATVRSDLWSVGVLLYESLTGEKPFEGDSPIAVSLAAMQGHYVPVLERRPDIDPALAAVIDRALQGEPAHRFVSAAEMAGLLRIAAGDPTVALHPLALDPDATGVLGSPTRAIGLGGVGLAAGGVAAGELADRQPGRLGDPITRDAELTNESFPDNESHRRNGPAILAVVGGLVLIAGLGVFLLISNLRPATTVPTHISTTTATTKPRVVVPPTTSPPSSTQPTVSSTTLPPTSSTTTTTSAPPTTSTTTTTVAPTSSTSTVTTTSQASTATSTPTSTTSTT
jgi:serine/threonine protein kinase